MQKKSHKPHQTDQTTHESAHLLWKLYMVLIRHELRFSLCGCSLSALHTHFLMCPEDELWEKNENHLHHNQHKTMCITGVFVTVLFLMFIFFFLSPEKVADIRNDQGGISSWLGNFGSLTYRPICRVNRQENTSAFKRNGCSHIKRLVTVLSKRHAFLIWPHFWIVWF